MKKFSILSVLCSCSDGTVCQINLRDLAITFSIFLVFNFLVILCLKNSKNKL